MLSAMGIVYLFLICGSGVATSVVCLTFTPKTDDIVYISIFCILLTLLLFTLFFIFFPRWFAYIEIDKEGIRLCNGFKKGKKNVYEVYKHIQIASYNHIYQKRYFIVLSKFALLDNQIEHINDVEITPSIIKLKLNEKTYKALCELLPEKLSVKLKIQKKALEN